MSNVEKYKVVQIFFMWEDKNQENCKFFCSFYSLILNFYELLKPKVGMSTLHANLCNVALGNVTPSLIS